MRTLSEVVFQDNSQLILFTTLAALLMALGFLFSTTDNNNYLFLNTVASKKLWGVLFLIHAFELFYSAFSIDLHRTVKQSMSVTGLLLWGGVFLSFTYFDSTPIASTEWLLLIPFLAELWVLLVGALIHVKQL